MPPSTLPASAYEALELPPDTVKILTNPKPEKSAAASPNLLENEPAKEHPLALSESSITLYAELLLHIRTVTLFASLRSFHTHATKATLHADGASITVTHEGASATIRLPIKVQGGGDAALQIPSQPPKKDLTLRLQIEEKDGTDFLGKVRAEERKANIVPWDGASLNGMEDVEIVCKSCHRVVVRQGAINEWRDLPNENWAEMMDFWHCHKPDEHHLHNHTHEAAAEKKGYAAGNRLQALAGVGFVDLASLLLKEQDCEGAQLSTEDLLTVTCKNCALIVGTSDPITSGWIIHKWSIGLLSSSSPLTTFSTEKFISARLLFLIENTGVRKFHVHPQPSHASLTTRFQTPSQAPASPVPSMLLWVFTPDLLFSSSLRSPTEVRNDPTRAMKIFYEKKTWALLRPGEVEDASVEDVEFPLELYEELERVLEGSRMVLPESARTFKGWEVGLVKRFDVGETDIEKGVENGVEKLTEQVSE